MGLGIWLVAGAASIVGWILGDWIGRAVWGDAVSAFVMAFALSVIAFVVVAMVLKIRSVRRR